MLVSEFLTATNYALRGTDDTTPADGSDEADYWVATLNRKKNELYTNSRVLWDATFLNTPPNEPGTVATTGTTTLTGTSTKFLDYAVGDKITVSGETVRTIATITSNTVLTVTVAFSNTASSKTFTRQTIILTGVEEYNLHRNLIAPANRIHVLTTDDDKVYTELIRARDDTTLDRRAFLSGVNPVSLTFTTDIESTENIIGGTLYVPGYYMPDDVDSATDEVPLPDPYWGVLATAAEVAFSDITYEDKAEGLNVKANNLYTQMLRNNRRGTYGHPRKASSSMYLIRGTEVK